ncbi:unnamed protein product [Absidia cylindrospora]
MNDIAVTTSSKDHDLFYCHTNHLPCPYQHQQQQQQQQHLTFFINPPSSSSEPIHTNIPGTWVDSNLHYCHCQTAVAAMNHHQEDMKHLKQTIASLRDQAKELERTDLIVKKSIQVVAKKRRLAQHSSQWDWCEPLDDLDEDDDDSEMVSSFIFYHPNGDSVPVLDDDSSETDHSVDDDNQDCGGDWEWIN